MPIYEYHCDACGRDFEWFQRMTDPAVTSCTFCKGPVRKLVSLTSFQLKGSGWYVTDYGGKKAPHSETAEKKDSPASDTAKTEAKPAATKAE